MMSPTLATVKFRHKHPYKVKSKLIEQVIQNRAERQPSQDFQFVQAVIGLGLLMRLSQYTGSANFYTIIALGAAAKTE